MKLRSQLNTDLLTWLAFLFLFQTWIFGISALQCWVGSVRYNNTNYQSHRPLFVETSCSYCTVSYYYYSVSKFYFQLLIHIFLDDKIGRSPALWYQNGSYLQLRAAVRTAGWMQGDKYHVGFEKRLDPC